LAHTARPRPDELGAASFSFGTRHSQAHTVDSVDALSFDLKFRFDYKRIVTSILFHGVHTMMPYRYRLIALILTAALSAAGCSDDAGTNNGTATNNGEGDVTEDTQQQLDAANDVADEDTGADATDTTDTAPSEPRWVPDFLYRNPDQGTGVSVNVQSGRIGKIGPANTLSEPMTAQEISDLKEQILTEETRDKMINGWDCGDANDIEGVRWLFEGRVLVDVDNREYEEIITNVAGCVPEDSTEADAARVQEIIAHLDGLKEVHFE
jgi:hypothetical protein